MMTSVARGAGARLFSAAEGSAAAKASSLYWIRTYGSAASEAAATPPPAAREPEKRGGESGGGKGIVSYWGVSPGQITKEDGTEWKWNCFRVIIS